MDGPNEQTAGRIWGWLSVTTEDLLDVDVDRPIAGATTAEYRILAEAHAQASRIERTENKGPGRAYAFIGAVLSLHLKEDAPNDPFGPMAVVGTKRSPATVDFGAKSDVLAEIAHRSVHSLVKARCADLAWLLDRKRSNCAQIAIDAYVEAVRGISSGALEFGFSSERRELHPGVRRLIARALQVARGARKQKVRTEELHDLTAHLFEKALNAGWIVGALWYGRYLLETDVLASQVVAARLEAFLQRPDPQTWIIPTTEAWNLIAQCYHRSGMKADAERCLGEAAEALVDHARDHGHSAMLRAHFLSDAIVQLQGVRGKRARRDEIKLLLREAQAGISDEMSTFSHEIDLTDISEPTTQTFERLGAIDQLFELALLDKSPAVEALRERALKQMSEHPIASMFTATIHDREGKVVEKAPGHSPDAPSDGAIRHAIARDEQLRRQLIVAGRIEAARHVINQSAHVSRDLLLWVIGSSPFVPSELKGTYAYGFSRFIQGDFIAATYVLTPLLEASLKHVLKQHGIDVSKFDDTNETQEDRTISAFFTDHRDQLDRIFNAANVASLEGIYLSKFGPYLRHAIAHGMLTDGGPFGSDAIYGCWLMFRLCMQPLLPYRERMKAMFEKQ